MTHVNVIARVLGQVDVPAIAKVAKSELHDMFGCTLFSQTSASQNVVSSGKRSTFFKRSAQARAKPIVSRRII